MSKLYRKPVEVRLDGEKLTSFYWRGRWLQVDSCQRVFVRRDYFDPYCNLPTYRVRASPGGLYDMVQDRDIWVLEKVWD